MDSNGWELDGDENGPSTRWNEDPNDARQPISGRPEHGLYSIVQTVPTEIAKRTRSLMILPPDLAWRCAKIGWKSP